MTLSKSIKITQTPLFTHRPHQIASRSKIWTFLSLLKIAQNPSLIRHIITIGSHNQILDFHAHFLKNHLKPLSHYRYHGNRSQRSQIIDLGSLNWVHPHHKITTPPPTNLKTSPHLLQFCAFLSFCAHYQNPTHTNIPSQNITWF